MEYRIYRDEGLSVRRKLPKRKQAWRHRQGRAAIGGPNEVWAMDFVSDRTFDACPFRILRVVDWHTREALSLTLKANFRAFGWPRLWPPWSGCGAAQKPARVQRAGACLSYARSVGLLNGVEIDLACPLKSGPP
jgi:putative transposase